MSFSGAIFGIIGVLLAWRACNEPLCRRSPGLVMITHIANLVEVEFFLLTLSLYDSDDDPNAEYLPVYQAVMLVSHYLFYFPYLLRCYRLHFVFNLGQYWDDSDQPFYNQRHRATQTWLIKVLLCLMVPVLIFGFCLIFIPEISSLYPMTYTAESSSDLAWMEFTDIFLDFIEELIFIIAVWKLREINDDFAMTRELGIVCLLWMTNSFLLTSLFPLEMWMYSCIIRNFMIMGVSSAWPVYKSFGKLSVEVPLTIEALKSIDLVLQSEAVCEAFSNYLQAGRFDSELSKLDMKASKLNNQEGYWLLEFWLECEVFKHNCTRDKALAIIENYLVSGLLKLPSHLANCLIEASVLTDVNLFTESQDYAYKMLAEYYFPLFQRSMAYATLAKDIIRQDIRLCRLASTSFMAGKGISIS